MNEADSDNTISEKNGQKENVSGQKSITIYGIHAALIATSLTFIMQITSGAEIADTHRLPLMLFTAGCALNIALLAILPIHAPTLSTLHAATVALAVTVTGGGILFYLAAYDYRYAGIFGIIILLTGALESLIKRDYRKRGIEPDPHS